MPQMDGLELCRAIRSCEKVGFVYTIILTAHADKEHVLTAFDAGAYDFLSKPFHEPELVARVKAGIRIVNLESDLARPNRIVHKAMAEMAVLSDKFERLARTDVLTELANRRNGLNRTGQPPSGAASRWPAS